MGVALHVAAAAPDGGLLRRARTLAGGAIVGQVAVVASTPILTRWYSPRELGIFAAFSALQSVLVVASCLRNDQAMPLARNSAAMFGLHRRCVRSVATVAGLTLLFAVVLEDPFHRLLGGDLTYTPLLLAAALGLDGLRQSYWAARLWLGDVRTVARSRAAMGMEQAVLQVGSGIAGFGAGGLCLGYALSRGAGLLSMIRRTRPQHTVVEDRGGPVAPATPVDSVAT